MDREYADNKSNTGNSARISEMEQGELSYFLKLFEYLRDALNNAPTSFMSRGKRMVDVDASRGDARRLQSLSGAGEHFARR